MKLNWVNVSRKNDANIMKMYFDKQENSRRYRFILEL